MNRTTAALAALILLSACTKASSTDIKTSGLYAAITGTGDGSGTTRLYTELKLDPNTLSFVEISGTGSLSATSGTETATLKKFELAGMVTYATNVAGDEEGKSVTVAFTRGAMDTSAPSSVLTLPAKFELTSPVAGTTLVRGKDQVEVKWDNSGKPDPMVFTLGGTCIETVVRASNGDYGILVIPAADIKASKDSETKSCGISLVVQRIRQGTLDPAYGKGGLAVGIQSRGIALNSAAP